MAVFKFRNLKSGQATPIPQGEFTIGRAEDASVQVDDPSVSRHHARLVNDEQGLFLEDLGSANGIAVRGAFVTGRAQVKLGDLVHVGKVPFRIDPETPEDSPPSSDMRRVDRASLRRETELLSSPESEAISSSKAITYLPSMAEPIPQNEASKSGALIRHSVPLPQLVRLTSTPAAAPVAPPVVESSRSVEMPPEADLADPGAVEEEELVASAQAMPWWWWLVVFLAGMGSGLLLGLFFAKLFLDMGGHPSSLP